ncbi:MAG: deoxyribose-phosphate aldolase [Bacillota bacterium]
MTIPQNIARMIDHTLLKPDSTGEDILKLCAEAVEYGFKAVCVNPSRVSTAARALAGTGIVVCAVAGFPLGASSTAAKSAEAFEAVKSGAAEIDMVINIGLLKEGKFDLVCRDISSVVEAAAAANPEALVKVIIETCYLTVSEKEDACRICESAGARYVKTSTGFGPSGATVEDVELISRTVSPAMGVKASGGIKTAAQALSMIRAGAARIGTSSGVQIMNEIKKVL